MKLKGEVNWQNIKESDLKNSDFLIRKFRTFLKKECRYSAEEAKFACDTVADPFRRNYCSTKK